MSEGWGTPKEELNLVLLLDPEKQVSIETKLGVTLREDLINFLRPNDDVFAWSHEDVSGIDPNIMVHRLNIDPNYKPIKQKCRPVNNACSYVIAEEVEKLLKAELIKRV